MAEPRIRAVLLTAGLGIRLRPLTLFMPKPLLPVCGRAVASYSLQSFSAAGCEAVALNLHYMGDMIREHFGSAYDRLPIEYSPEEELRGTLGVLSPLAEFLSVADVILLANGDTLCQWPWQAMLKEHLRSEAEATLLLHERVPDQELGGPIGVDSDGSVVKLRDSPKTGQISRRHLFAGAHILSPRLLDRVRDRVGDIVADLYIPLLLEGGRIHSVTTSVDWHDLGTPERFLRANIECQETGRSLGGWVPPVSSRPQIDSTASIRRTSIQPSAVVEQGSLLEDSVVLQDAVVAPNCQIKSSIVGPGVRVPAGSRIERQMLTCIRSGYAVSARDSLVGNLLSCPLSLD